VRWKKVSLIELRGLIREQAPDVPSEAARWLAAAFFMCLPLPDAWAKALTHLRRLKEYADNPQLDRVLAELQMIYDEERDRLWRTHGDLHFAPYQVFRQRPASTRTRRRLLVYYGVEALRAAGLPLESRRGGPNAYEIMRRLLHRLWLTEVRGVAKLESIERAHFRGKEEVESTRFARGRPRAAIMGGEPQMQAAAGPDTPAAARYPTAEEFWKFVAGAYRDTDTAWMPVQDNRPEPRA
jgi:hypothetical protein